MVQTTMDMFGRVDKGLLMVNMGMPLRVRMQHPKDDSIDTFSRDFVTSE